MTESQQSQTRDGDVVYLLVPKVRADEIKRILNENQQVEDSKSDAVLMTETVDLGNGWQLDQKLCNGDTPWVDTVLFYNGTEQWVYEPGDEFFTDIKLLDLGVTVSIVPMEQ